MKFEKFTMKAQEALASSQQMAMAQSNITVSPLHLLSVLLDDDEGIVIMILKKIGVNIARLKEMTKSEVSRLPKGTPAGQMMMPDPAFGQIVLDAQNRADRMGD